MSDLPAQIINLRGDTTGLEATHAISFRLGHGAARHAAAELAGVEIDRLEQQRDELLAALKGAVEIATNAHVYWDADQDAKVGKHLIALSGGLKGYDARTDAIHAAIAKAESAA